MASSARLPAVLSLVLGMAITGVLYARRPGGPDAVPDDPAAAAALAHEAAGVVVGDVGPVAPGFQSRVDSLRARVETTPDDLDGVLELARLLHDGHRPDEAVPFYRRALELEPGRAEVTYDLAAALSAAGDAEGASDVLRRRLDDVPDDAVAMYNLGALRANAGDMEGARRWFDRAVTTTSDGALRARAREALDRLGGDR